VVVIRKLCATAPDMLSRCPAAALVVALLASACALQGAEEVSQEEDDLQQVTVALGSDVWVHLDSNVGLRAAALTALNGAAMRCPSGGGALRTCTVSSLVLPSDCVVSCQNGLLGHQGETILRGRFVGQTFVVSQGFDTSTTGMGAETLYLVRGSDTCAVDPCPAQLVRQKLNGRPRQESVKSLSFATAVDLSFRADEARGYDLTTSVQGLPVSGRTAQGVFRADRVWRLETPKPNNCDPLLSARAHAYRGDATSLLEYRTQAEAESAPNVGATSRAWMVRTAETPGSITFTSGLNDLWVERFSISKVSCAITTLEEH
jgi:hypothetical protein